MTTADTQASHVMAVVAASKDPIFDLGGRWMSSDDEEAATTAAGFEGWQLYFLGRHGVLGDVDPDVIVSAAYFFEPEYLSREWDAARTVMSPPEAVEIYATLCHDWGRKHLAGFEGAGRLAELAEQVIEGTDVAGMPLFAGWRALPTPLDLPARCAHDLQLLREHRGACHGVAMVASGLSPLMTILTNENNTHTLEEFGWFPPYPEVTEADRRRRARVEKLTDELVALPYEVLTEAEGDEFVELLQAAHAHVGPGSVEAE